MLDTLEFWTENNDDPLFKHKPLFIGCSGGGGHIAAINAIQQRLVHLIR